MVTDYVGELIQHDASYHVWAPAAGVEWPMITSLDDYSRFMLYAKLLEHESSWAHIESSSSIILTYGCPYQYYIDCHSIFRYVKGRDQLHHNFTKFTDDVDPQWKQVILQCQIKPVYALSPQAKGKIERPYRWMQDRLMRTCVRDNVKDINHAQRILDQDVKRYNFKQVHSTTNEIPYIRFQRAPDSGKSLFRPSVIPKPFLLPKDIFCLRTDRMVDGYRTVSLGNMKFKLNCDDSRFSVNIRIYLLKNNLVELRFWHKDKLIDVRTVKKADLKLSTFHL